MPNPNPDSKSTLLRMHPQYTTDYISRENFRYHFNPSGKYPLMNQVVALQHISRIRFFPDIVRTPFILCEWQIRQYFKGFFSVPNRRNYRGISKFYKTEIFS